MTGDMNSAVEILFHEAVDLDPAARDRLLTDAERTAPEVVAEVRGYLHVDESYPDFLSTPVELGPDDVVDEASEPEAPVRLETGQVVQGYTIQRFLGSGSTGEVYEAEQQRPRRRVALKVLRRELSSTRMVRRFEHEAEVLAALQHEGIAQIYEVGSFGMQNRDVPFLAMEHISGALPLTHWATAERLDREARIDLFVKVCRAVEHAHGRGAIHRDLKPANILVGRDGRPRVIDFGLARVVDPVGSLSADSNDDRLVGTLQYMSPEQCAGGAADVDVRSDVYSLGVVLHQLLFELPPYELEGKSLAEIARVIRDRHPRRPHHVEDDLWTIVSVALAKDRDGRYRSAAELADDLTALRHHEPIRARPPSAWYRFRLFARRHRALVGVSSASAVLLLVGAATILMLYLDNRKQLAQLQESQREEKRQQFAINAARIELRGLEQKLDQALGLVDQTEKVDAGRFVASVAAIAQSTEADQDRSLLVGLAFETLQRLEQEVGETPEFKRSLAIAYTKVGNLHGGEWFAKPEQVENSGRAYEQAVARWREVVGDGSCEGPSRSDCRALVDALVRHGESLRKLKRGPEAIALADEAVAVCESLAKSDRDDTLCRLDWMSALFVRGDARIPTNDALAGTADSRLAVELGEGLLARAPNDLAILQHSAMAEFRLALWIGRCGDSPEEAIAHAERATSIRLRTMELAPDRTDLVIMFCTFLGTEFETLRYANRPEEIPDRLAVYMSWVEPRLGYGADRELVWWFAYWRHEEAALRFEEHDFEGTARVSVELRTKLAQIPGAIERDQRVRELLARTDKLAWEAEKNRGR